MEVELRCRKLTDHYNNLQKKHHPKPAYEPAKYNGLFHFRDKLNSREKIYSRFLHYKYFCFNDFPTILTEGKTDNVYLKSALSMLQANYPTLTKVKTTSTAYEPMLNFPNLNDKTMYFLDLDGGASHFLRFVTRYSADHNYFENQKAKSPVILILDNDDGPETLLKHLVKKVKSCPNDLKVLKSGGFLHLFHNLYLILTPLNTNGKDSMMEDLFDSATMKVVLNGKTFSTDKNPDIKKHYGKHIFSTKVVRSNKSNINFDKFKYIFDEVVKVKQHFSTLKN
ncbi:hypothetical protein [Psychromonas antarctica]|uniref:hypothetical protein n=1 Tax=Psychromonas antarctica TaxID=67573 RepID=UPI001EE78B47|nr:hypothetical protein [Psychromonas antarctica]MCG6202749.1 hypothetical protein [Psychromonas antarctica]